MIEVQVGRAEACETTDMKEMSADIKKVLCCMQ